MFISDPQFTGFEWDEDKRQANVQKHSIDFARVILFVKTAHLVVPSTRQG